MELSSQLTSNISFLRNACEIDPAMIGYADVRLLGESTLCSFIYDFEAEKDIDLSCYIDDKVLSEAYRRYCEERDFEEMTSLEEGVHYFSL